MNVDSLYNARRLSCSQCPEGHYTKGDKVYAKCVLCGHEVTYGDFQLDGDQERITFADDGYLYVYDVQYVATINTPGYMPWNDDPPVFDTPQEAWSYLLDERRRLEDDAFELGTSTEEGYSSTFNTIESIAEGDMEFVDAGLDHDGTGSIGADDPTYDGDHPLGLVYSVSEAEVDG